MNTVHLMGRLTNDPTVYQSKRGDGSISCAKYSLAVPKPYRKDKDRETNFIPVVAFSHNAEFAAKYLKKGMRIAVVGEISSSGLKNSDGTTKRVFEVIARETEFCESKAKTQDTNIPETPADAGFVDVPDDAVEDEGMPFN